jgi:mannose-1-phosphate guanylyltransferase/mannose-6-phosphate isomerase
MKVIVLAGGGGTRLWPLSTNDFPKQFLKLGSELSLLQRTVKRFHQAPFVDEILVSTNKLYEPLVRKQLGPDCRILVEPSRKNTGPAIALAVQELHASPNEPILVVPSDHLIEPENVFLRCVEQIQATLTEHIVLFGIRPTKPETGFGYIRIGQPFNHTTYQALGFVEKPNAETALRFLKSREYYWNAGMFAFTPQVFFRELELHAPDIVKQLYMGHYDAMPDLSIDYALMEKAKNLVVCPLPVEWSDVGSWDSVYELMEKDEHQNAVQGNVVTVDTKNSLILGSKKLISTVGIEDLLIVETDTALFISKKGRSQQVKDLVSLLTKKNLTT